MFCRALVPFVLAVWAAGDADCNAKTEVDEVAMLQSRISTHREGLADTTCPGSGIACHGDQCCNGFAGSSGLTFPCPNAPEGWNECQGTFPANQSSGGCCYADGCNSCNPAGHWCDSESKCTGECKGSWCSATLVQKS